MEKWKGINEGGLSVVWNRIKANFVSSIGFANNQFTWSKGGVAQTPFTIGYATDSDTLDGYHASTWFKYGCAYPEGKSDKPYHLVAECEMDITSGGQTNIISFFVRRFYNNLNDTKHSGILVLRFRWNKNESAPTIASATWSLNTELPTGNFILTYKNDEGIVTCRLYAKLTGYNSYTFTKIDETFVKALADNWVLHEATNSNEYAFASIPQDETQVVSENATITNPIAWSSVSGKPAAAGDATTPVYWTGSGFTACTPYANASVNYATSAGKATNDSDGNAINTTYLKLAGGTLANNAIGVLFIQRNNTSASAMIGFKKYSEGTTVETIGYIGMRSKDGPLKRWSGDASSSYVIWDEGNDGSGSGLDADKLDGQESSYYATASSVTTLQGYFTDGKAKKANADGDGNTISTTYLKVTLKGAANGLAELDSNGLVPSSQLPAYVDDVLEYASKSVFPSTGTSGKIYVALDTNLTYRWSGSAYTEISPSLALGETSSTAYRGDRGKTAYTHATDSARLTTAKSSGFYKFATTAEGHIASVTAVTASDLTTLIGANTYAPYNATGYQVKVSKLGSTTKPLYTSAAGTFAECSTYAGGTAVTLNGTSKAASTASFYAPTTAGTAGQILTSTAGTPEWKTGELIHPLTSVSGTAAVTTSPYYASQWEGTADGVTALYTGLTVTIKVPVAGNGSYGTLLNVNNLGVHPVLANVSTMVGTRYAVGCMVTLVYDADQTGSAYINSASASTITGCWKIAEYDSTNTHQLRMYYGYYKPTTNLYRYMLCFQKDSTQVVPVNAVENSTATTKTLTTEAFNPFGFILYYNSTTTINAGSVISAGTLYEQIHLDLRYSFNTAKNLTANKDIYIVTNLQSDGMVKLDSSPITQTLPNSDDGKLYIYLGQALSTYQIEIRPYHPVYWYKDGKVQLYTPMSANALRLTATSKTAWGRTFWTANGVPDSISGDMRSVGSVFLNNVASLRWKKNGASSGTDEDYLPVMVVSTDNNLYLGPFNAGKTCATIIYGKPIRFYTKSSDGNNTGVLAATIDADSNFKTEGSIYLNNNNTSIYFKNSASTGVPLLTFDNSSTSVFKVGDGSYPTKTYGSSIEMYAGTNKVASFKMLDGVRTAEFTSQVIIQNNTSLGFYKSDNATIARVLAVNNNATNAVLMGTFMAATPLPLQVYGSDITFYINNGTSNTEAAKIDANKNFTAQGSVVGMKGVAAYGIADLALITD